MRDDHDTGVTRRRALQTIAASAAAGGLLAASPRRVAAQTDLSGWFADTDNADEVVDRTDADAVTVRVGTDGNGAGFGFGPAAVRVDAGTTVVWEWTGQGGDHNVVAEDGSFESDLQGEGTFEHTFDAPGVTRYACTPHEAMGMKGAVVVGDADVRLGGGGADPTATPAADGDSSDGGDAEFSDVAVDYGDWFADVGNFAGTVDRRGEDEVRIGVGAEGNGGGFAFDPPAVHVDPGATVVWEWTGQGGQHDVVAEDADLGVESPLQAEAGATYGVEFDGQGVVKYACTPHEAMGMRGAVVVGDPTAGGGVDWLRTSLLGLAGAIVAAPFVASEVAARRRRGDDSSEPPRRRE